MFLSRVIFKFIFSADLLVLDDPLSALNMEVADKIMEEAICKSLKGKTRIITTHAIHYLKYADYVYVMERGKIKLEGTYKNVKDSEIIKELKKATEVIQYY